MAKDRKERNLLPASYRESRMCGDKVRLTKNRARYVASVLRSIHGWTIDAYKCDYCNKYHLGRSNRTITPEDIDAIR